MVHSERGVHPYATSEVGQRLHRTDHHSWLGNDLSIRPRRDSEKPDFRKHHSFPDDIAAGPDGALWFTVRVYNNDAPFHAYSAGGFIGRLTTAGHVSSYNSSEINGALSIASGPDGALWFADYNYPFLGSTFGAVDRIDTSGHVSTYVEPGVAYVSDITMGPDGAMWFVNISNDTIGRITPP